MSTATQAVLRTKWPDLIESPVLESAGVRNIAGWLKQASLEVKQAGIKKGKMVLSDEEYKTITILHFNDVYNVDEQPDEPVGGATRFSTALKSLSYLQPLVLFSGDVLSPSNLSTYTKGEHMSKVLNELGVQCAVFGNHEFDFGLEVLLERVSEMNFPWLMSNVIDNETGRPLGDGKITHVIDYRGIRIGLMGLVEQEWLETLATINIEEVTFLDFVDSAQRLGAQLKKQGCDYVIALTHMRTPNDIILAEKTTNVDLILGGHDHVYEVLQVNGKYIIKSGTDFRQFSKITINFQDKPSVEVCEMNVTSDIEEETTMQKILQQYSDTIKEKQSEVLGVFTVPLEGRFAKIRTEETNLGNWIADILLAATGADVVLLNSGTFRSDRLHPPGEFRLGDLINVVPYCEPTVLLLVSGGDLLAALENGVSKYPKMEGRFPQVAGLSFAFDPNMPEGQRVDPEFVRIGDEYLVIDQKYKLATKSYIQGGYDGYTCIRDATVLVPPELSPSLALTIRNHFEAIKIRQNKTKKLSTHRQSLVTLSRRHSLVKQFEGAELHGPAPIRRNSADPQCQRHHHHSSLDGYHVHHNVGDHGHVHIPPPRISRRTSFDELEEDSCILAPAIEGRIIKLDDEKRKELKLLRKRLESDSVIPEIEETENSSPQQSFDNC